MAGFQASECKEIATRYAVFNLGSLAPKCRRVFRYCQIGLVVQLMLEKKIFELRSLLRK